MALGLGTMLKNALAVHHGYYLNLNIHFLAFPTEIPPELTSVDSWKSNITKQEKWGLSGDWTEFEIEPIREKEIQTKCLIPFIFWNGTLYSCFVVRWVANKCNK